MKAIYRIFIAIFAAAALAVSCSKDAVPGGGAQAVTDGPRVITLSFGGYTKSSLDGFTPKFSAGDRVMLSNGTRAEECTVNVDAKGKATVTTNLTGILNAVSPASAAVTGGGELTYKIPVTQSGRFSDAAIATAQDIISSAVFEIQVSLLKFYVDQSISVKSIIVTGTGTQNIATSGTNLKQVTVDAGTGCFLHETTDDPEHRLCYAAVLPGIPASSLKFTSDTDTQGTVERQSPASTVTLAANTLYKAFIPYYIKIGSQKWAYCNIGAFLPEEAGKYYPWADTEGHYYDGTTFDGEISWNNYKYASGPYAESSTAAKKVFTKYVSTTDASTYWNGTGSADNKLSMEPADDAAFVELGENWHIPTCGDFSALASVSTKSWNGTDMGYYFGTSPTCIFLPAAGYAGNNSTLTRASEGLYWSSTLSISTDYLTTENKRSSHAFYFGFSASSTPSAIHSGLRPHGMSIRPIYKTPAGPLDIGEYDEPVSIE